MQHAQRRPAGPAKWSATSLLVVSSAALLTGCSVADDVMATVGRQTSETVPAQPNVDSNALIVTAPQRAYLDALKAAGVKPSNDLTALSIGSYVCQARAARQSDQGVWDFVLPMVRGDERNTPMSSMALNSATADYIRIATEKLC